MINIHVRKNGSAEWTNHVAESVSVEDRVLVLRGPVMEVLRTFDIDEVAEWYED